jgi:hypothetical protein
MGTAEAVRAQRRERAAGDVQLHSEYRVPGEGDDRLKSKVPRRHALPAAVCGREPASRRDGEQPGNWVVREHTVNRTDTGELLPAACAAAIASRSPALSKASQRVIDSDELTAPEPPICALMANASDSTAGGQI